MALVQTQPYMTALPGWNSPRSVMEIHSELEAIALVFFALLVAFDVFGHLVEDRKRKLLFERVGLICFGIAVLSEIGAYPYGRRNDELSTTRIAALNLRAEQASKDAELAKATARGFERDIAKANENAAKANARAAEARLGLARLRLPRRLSLAQRTRLASEFRPYAGQKFSLCVAGDSESLDLLAALREVFSRAGWIKTQAVGYGDISIGDAALAYGRGVIIHFAP